MMTKVAAALAAIGDARSNALTARSVPASLTLAVMSNDDIDALPNGRCEWSPEQVSASAPTYAPHENVTRRRFRESVGR